QVFIILDGEVALILYGPLMFYLPDRVNDFLVLAYANQLHTTWQLLFAPCLVQWLHLARRDFIITRKVILAYTIP
ncbi:hypothetical protein PMAYCL1PPCAC_15806, partial [Pristionchus mayeri]